MEEEKSKGAEEEHGQSGASANVLLDKGMEKKEEVKEDGEKPAWIRHLEEFVAGLWLWQEEEEEANAGSTATCLQSTSGRPHQKALPAYPSPPAA